MSTKKAAKNKRPLKPAKKAAKKPASCQPCLPSPFHWSELQTTGPKAAKAFYTKLFGWKTEPFGGGMDYTILLHEGKGFGGIMKTPVSGRPAMWLAYAVVKDVDAVVAQVEKLGGKACKAFDVPGVGRLSIVEDPQGALFGIHEPKM